ncbi:4Fe-4S dicluster-binding protein [Neomoorella humiferrea]|uniref:4Fe-4S dicluster domain-containing protein n=1 Tax=Neomoorella humiferrea TaxID=676965 RepID=UPI003D914D76
MKIDSQKCVGCGRCQHYCTMGAIYFRQTMGKVHAAVNEEECVDCGVCERAKVCPVDALYQPIHDWPRSIRGTFSNPLAEHKETKVPGRGTEEMKTNDVTGRYRPGFVGLAVEMGRPGTGAKMPEIEKVVMALAALGVEFETKNPLTSLIVDRKTGKMHPEAMNEKVLSAIIEMLIPLDQVPRVLHAVKKVAAEINTVFSVDLTSRADENGLSPGALLAAEHGYKISINGKTNLGLGRPLAREV